MPMTIYTLASLILSLAVAMTYLNVRYLKLQNTILLTLAAITLSLFFIILQHSGLADIANQTRDLLRRTDFHKLVINGMLSFLLFAGALTIDLSSLKSRQWEVAILSSISTIFSALLIGFITYLLLPLFGMPLPLMYCMLFGALISPTDPIAVLATFKEVGAPKKLEACIAGESLFNDGVGIVIFLTIFGLSFDQAPITFKNVTLLFLEQAVGGVAYGAFLGTVAYGLIKSLKDTETMILITLMLVTGGYALALAINISGPLAMVVAGILLGNKIPKTIEKHHSDLLQAFWKIIDELLNAILFLLIGFELLEIDFSQSKIYLLAFAIPLVLLVRLVTVAIPMKLLQLNKKKHEPLAITILTWGGLRGALAIALALTLPGKPYRDIILTMTYFVVVFAVVVQGLTIKPLASLIKRRTEAT